MFTKKVEALKGLSVKLGEIQVRINLEHHVWLTAFFQMAETDIKGE